MNKKEISENLLLISKLLIIAGENQFKARAFENASRIISQLENFDELIRNKKLNSVKGIGKSIEKEVYNLYENAISETLEDLKLKIPEGIIEILSLKGLGAKKVKILFEKLGVSSVGELEYACNENRLMLLKGFGKKTQDNILKSIRKFKERKMYIHFPEAETVAKNILLELQPMQFIDKIAVSGDVRRKIEIINYIDFVVSVLDKDAFIKEFGKLKNTEINGFKIEFVESVILNRKCRFFITDNLNFKKILFITTGSEKFLKNFEITTDFNNESDFFKKKNLNFIIPELRENDVINISPKDIINFQSLKGVVHIHTTYSDGANSIEEIVKYLIEKGFSYAGITDHSKSAYYANGLKEDDIKKQHEEIDKLNEKYKEFKIFKGIESDILRDGSLDYPDNILEKFDFVIASVHSSFNLSKQEMTDRIIKAIENPYTTILGHPTGRLILFREAYKLDIDKVLEALKNSKKFVEINSHPYRLDLSWENCIKASKHGIRFLITPDAHNLEGFNYLKYGIIVARKAGIKANQIINTYTCKEFQKILTKNI